MSGPEASVLLGLSHDARGRHFTIDEAGTEPGLKCRLLLESDSPRARSLEGRQLAMYFSLMLPDRSGLRLFEPAATTSAARAVPLPEPGADLCTAGTLEASAPRVRGGCAARAARRARGANSSSPTRSAELTSQIS